MTGVTRFSSQSTRTFTIRHTQIDPARPVGARAWPGNGNILTDFLRFVQLAFLSGATPSRAVTSHEAGAGFTTHLTIYRKNIVSLS